MTENVDVVVIGMGPGGEDAAGSLAEAGLRVVGIERTLVGGECPYWGCVPSKMMIRAADLPAEARRIPGVAGAASVTPDWSPVARRIREQATDNWDDRVAVERFEGKGGIFVRGRGAVAEPGKVRSTERRTPPHERSSSQLARRPPSLRFQGSIEYPTGPTTRPSRRTACRPR
jgi:pyruvate/2-oxoglutarate dehydrogenase complex dihydrolipoamide dehydrogenase (E3) component